MHSQTKIEAVTVNETANTAFQLLTIAMVGLFCLAQTLNFLVSAV